MKIAFIGWGSLLRVSHALKIAGKWQSDGPFLPLEFAYVTKSGILALAIHPDSCQVQTFWAQSDFEVLEEAKAALGKHSKTELSNICFFCGAENSNNGELTLTITTNLRAWVEPKKLDAVVWIGRGSNFKEATGTDFSEDNVIDYVTGLSKNQRLAAEKYVISNPEQIETAIRRRLRIELGWRNLSEYKTGFWLDKNTFTVADAVDIKMVRRKAVGDPLERSERVPMLMMANVTQMIVDNDGKILGEDRIASFGLWLDDVKRLYKEQELWNKEK